MVLVIKCEVSQCIFSLKKVTGRQRFDGIICYGKMYSEGMQDLTDSIGLITHITAS